MALSFFSRRESRPAHHREIGLLHCATPREYVAAILDLEFLCEQHSSRVVPVLGDGSDAAESSRRNLAYRETPSHRSVAADGIASMARCYAEGNLAATVRNRHDVIVLDCAHETAWIGLGYAAFHGRRVLCVASLAELADAFGSSEHASATVVTSSSALRQHGTDDIRRVMAAFRPDTGFQWGILVASDARALSRVVARMLLPREPGPFSGRFWVGSEYPATTPREHFEIVRPGMHALEGLRAMQRSAVDLTMLIGHGRSYCAVGGALCLGRATEENGLVCVKGGECAVPRGTEHAGIPSRQMRTRVAFIDSCLAGNFQCHPLPGSNVSLDLLDGHALAVVAPSEIREGGLLGPYLVWDRLSRGQSLGAATHAINSHARETVRLNEQYLLFGDPTFVPYETSDAPSARFGWSRSDDRWVLRFEAEAGPTQHFVLEDAELAGAVRAAAVFPLMEPREVPLQVVLLPGRHPDQCELTLVWRQSPREGECELVLTTAPPIERAVVDIAAAFVANARLNEPLRSSAAGIPDGYEEGEADAAVELEGLVRQHEAALVNYFLQARRPPMAYGGLRELGSRLESLCFRAGEELLADASAACSYQSLLSNKWSEVQGIVFESPEEHARCACGGGTRVLSYVVGVGGARRVFESCNACLAWRDLPREAARDVWLECPEAMQPASRAELLLHVRNASSGAVLVHACLDMLRNNGKFSVAPSTQRAVVAPGETVSLPFAMTPRADVLRNIHTLKGLLSINGALGQVGRPVSVGLDA